MDSKFTKESFKYWSDENERTILEPYNYLAKNSGKGFRQQLSLAFNQWLRIPDSKLEVINEIIDMLHNSSLLIDDIEDSSFLRRGLPSSHRIYGLPTALNCGNYVYFLALEKCLSLGNDAVAHIFTEQMLHLHRGQGMDIHWRDTFTCPSEDEYKCMVIMKTGGLFGMAIRLMQLFSNDKRDYSALIENLGLFFQIRDDLANLIDETYHANKSFAEDLTEGKFSFPIVVAIHQNQSDHQVMSILRQHTEDVNIKRHCIHLMRQMGTFNYTATVLTEIEMKCRNIINDFGGNVHLLSLLDKYNQLYRDLSKNSGDSN